MSNEGVQETASVFQRELNNDSGAPQQPRDDRGRFSGQPVERMFENFGEVEPDKETGDRRDGGDDPRLRAKEQDNGEGVPRSREEGSDAESEQELPDESGDGEGDAEQDTEARGEDEGPEYEVTVDGTPTKVKLREALDGYIRTETFHQRMNQVHGAAMQVRDEAVKVATRRDEYIKKLSDIEADIEGMMPKEPDWDSEFAKNPQEAHRLQKQYGDVRGKLEAIRQERARIEQEKAQEQSMALQHFIAQGREKFLSDRQFKDQADYERHLGAMRKTALEEGFQENEIGQVFDPRMLNVLWKASMYDRIIANRPKPVNPSQGKTLKPGTGNSASRGRNTGRKEIDSAQERLRKSGTLDSATDFFRTILR